MVNFAIFCAYRKKNLAKTRRIGQCYFYSRCEVYSCHLDDGTCSKQQCDTSTLRC